MRRGDQHRSPDYDQSVLDECKALLDKAAAENRGKELCEEIIRSVAKMIVIDEAHKVAAAGRHVLCGGVGQINGVTTELTIAARSLLYVIVKRNAQPHIEATVCGYAYRDVGLCVVPPSGANGVVVKLTGLPFPLSDCPLEVRGSVIDAQWNLKVDAVKQPDGLVHKANREAVHYEAVQEQVKQWIDDRLSNANTRAAQLDVELEEQQEEMESVQALEGKSEIN